MTDNSNNPGEINPLIPDPVNILDANKEDDEPIITLLGPLNKIRVSGTCDLCGKKSDGRFTIYHNLSYFVCDSCRKLKEEDMEKRFHEIEKRKTKKRT